MSDRHVPAPHSLPARMDRSGGAPTTAPVCCIPEWRRQQAAQSARQYREARFNAICPPNCRESDSDRIPRDKCTTVLDWNFNPRGLLLIGPTGTCKTRCAWLLIRRLLLDEARTVEAYDGIGWAMSVSKAFGEPATTERWLDSVCKPDVLFLDDLFKAKMTEAQELAIYGTFERRSAWRLPIIATMNSTGASILSRMTDNGRDDRGPPMLRRMQDFCDIVRFDTEDGFHSASANS